MMRYASPQPGDVLLDPVCGSGATLFTPLLPVDVSAFIRLACDIAGGREGDVAKAAANYCGNKRARGGVVNCDLKALPFRDASVDIVVADLPYGQKCSKWNHVRAL
jgi:tRNA G10  N-methylase Trm11